ncbi:MAG: hypothetical protein QG589_147 [Patescibacteria group bacterium]|nr:hypothetical protein [Patescibacteria group bacterium]
METKKIALACFIGGVICGAVALAVTPEIWWLGVLAGFAGGYISYEFRSVLAAIPLAWQSAKLAIPRKLRQTKHDFWQWLIKPRPFMYGGAVLTAVFFAIQFSVGNFNPLPHHVVPMTEIEIFAAVFSWGVFFWLCTPIGALIYGATCLLGNKGEDVDKLNYQEAFYAFRKGVPYILRFLGWTMWKYVGLAISYVGYRIGSFLWHVIKLIHSEKRVLCGIDGALGGTLSYFLFRSYGMPIITVIFGGLIGAALGVLNWEIVSKRILHVVPEES